MGKPERWGWLIALVVVAWLSVGPMIGLVTGPRYWPGLFYFPFYTTNLFTDPTTPGWEAGLRPEYRLVSVNRERIDRLAAQTEEQGAAGGTLLLLWESGRDAVFVRVPVVPLGWERILEKFGPLLLTSLGMTYLGWRGNNRLAYLSGLATLAALDYWLNPGTGRESGFDPAGWLSEGRFLMLSAKWSSYFYWPLWITVWAALGWHFAKLAFGGRSRRGIYALIAALTLAELAWYSYEAARTATFNNPDFITLHIRAIFWPAWVIVFGLAVGFLWQNRLKPKAWLSLAALLTFFAGWAIPTTFNNAWLFVPGPQWFVITLLLAFRR